MSRAIVPTLPARCFTDATCPTGRRYGASSGDGVGGTIPCTGDNAFGQLGDGTTTMRWTPVVVRGGGNDLVAVGRDHSCSIKHNAISCWGRNDSGQLRDGTMTEHHSPTSIGEKGQLATCAIPTAGGLACWGKNDHGQLGDGTMMNHPGPTPVSLSGVISFAAGGAHTCAVAELAVGAGGLSQDDATPGTPSITGAVQIVAGLAHTCARTSSSDVYCWGLLGPAVMMQLCP